MKKKVFFLSTIIIFVVTLTMIYFGASSPGKNNLQSDGLTNPNPGFINFTPTWSTGAPLPVATCNGGGARYIRNDTGWIYTIGGWTSSGLTANVRRYNVNTNTWSDMAPLPAPLEYFATATLNNNIYVIGGYNGTNSVNTFYKYDINSNTWTTTGINFPITAEDCKAVGYQDSLIYVAGGWTTSTINNVYLYNKNTNSFRTATPLPAPRHNGAFSRSGDTLVYIGGLTDGSVVTATTYKGLITNVDNRFITWTSGLDYPGGPREGWDAVNWGGYGIIVAGGWNGTGYTNTCYRYSPGTNTWLSYLIKPTSEYTSFVGSVFVGNNIWKLVTIGGWNGSLLSANEILTDSIFTLHDVSTQSIDFSVIQPGIYVPHATFYNNGQVNETFIVTMIIGPYTSTKSVNNLSTGASQQVSFDSWDFTQGEYLVKAYTQLTRDMNHTNDTLRKGLYVTNQGWTFGASNLYNIVRAASIGYSRNDTGWVFSIGGLSIALKDDLIVHNVNTNDWVVKSPLPEPRMDAASAILKDSLYLIGGYNGTNKINTVYKYNINADVWTTRANFPFNIDYCQAVGYQDSLIYVAGGVNDSGETNSVYLYNSNTNSWRIATSFPVNVSRGAFSRTGDTLIYVGGSNNLNPSAATYKGIINKSNKSIISWTQGVDYPDGPLFGIGAAPWGNLGIIMVGGVSSHAIYTSSKCYIYRPGANIWTPRPDKHISEAFGIVGSVYLGNNIWKFIVSSGENIRPLDTTELWTETISTIGIKNINSTIPNNFILYQNYPNPFNPSTKIKFDIPAVGQRHAFDVRLKIYDIIGREITTLVNEALQPGTYEVTFDGSNLPSGIYFYRLTTGGFNKTKSMILIK